MKLLPQATDFVYLIFQKDRTDRGSPATRWFRSWLITEKDEDLVKRLESTPDDPSTKRDLKLILRQLLGNEQFVRELKKRMKEYDRQQPRMKNVLDDVQLEAGRNVHIGDVGPGSPPEDYDQKNVIRGSTIKAGGDFRLGDDQDSPSITYNIDKQINIKDMHGTVVSPTPGGTVLRQAGLQPAERFTHGYALLIGVGGDLPGSVRDVQRMARLLTDPARAAYPESQVWALTGPEATREAVLAALDRMAGQVKEDPEATVIIHYSGHGGHFAGREENTYYLLAAGASNAAMIPGELFSQKINAIPAKKMLVLLDCCHAEGITERELGHQELEESNKTLLQMLAGGKGRVIVAACEDDEKSLEIDGSYGLFTQALLEALAGVNSAEGQDYVHILDVLQYLFEIVPVRAAQYRKSQHPVVNEIKSLDAHFYLCRYDREKATAKKKKVPQSERQRLQKQASQSVFNYGHINKQINIDKNKGPLYL